MPADATTPHTPEPAGDQDTIAYARQLVDAVDNLNQLAADIDHTCEPRWWPKHLGQTWTCDCGRGYHTARARDMHNEVSDKAIRLGILNPDQLGWCSDA